MTSNEVRQIIGLKPSDDPKADKLVNSNMPQPEDENKDKSSGQTGEESTNNAVDETINQAFGNVPMSAIEF